MQIYCLICTKHTDNIVSKKVIMTNKVIWEASRCANFISDKSRFLNKKLLKKVVWIILIHNYLCNNHCVITNMLIYCLKCKTIQRM